MVEVKFNQSDANSCRSSAGYHSTTRGQLELKWRLMRLFKAVPQMKVYGTSDVVENDALINCYMDRDGKYASVVGVGRLGREGRRRLRLVEGAGEFFSRYASPCRFEKIFSLAMIDDTVNPLDTNPYLRPRPFDVSGQEVADGINQFCWMSKEVIEQRPGGRPEEERR